MAAEVYFRGPMLFLSNKTKSDEVYIPHAERDICSDDGKLKQNHADGSVATWHYCGLMIAQGQQIVEQFSLQQKIVTISDGSGAACHYNNNNLFLIDDIVPDAFKKPLALVAEKDKTFCDRVATRVRFEGGVLRDGMYTDAQFYMDAGTASYKVPLTRPVAGHWYTTQAATVITVADADGSNATPYPLTTDQKVYIYNWDKNNPSVDDLTKITLVPVGKVVQADIDYKWLYQLYEPLVGKTAILKKAGSMLPAPLTMVDHLPITPSMKGGVFSVGSAGCVAGGGGGI